MTLHSAWAGSGATDPYYLRLLEHPVAKERRVQRNTFSAAIASTRSRARLHKDPLAAMALFIEKDPSVFFQYVYAAPRPLPQNRKNSQQL